MHQTLLASFQGKNKTKHPLLYVYLLDSKVQYHRFVNAHIHINSVISKKDAQDAANHAWKSTKDNKLSSTQIDALIDEYLTRSPMMKSIMSKQSVLFKPIQTSVVPPIITIAETLVSISIPPHSCKRKCPAIEKLQQAQSASTNKVIALKTAKDALLTLSQILKRNYC